MTSDTVRRLAEEKYPHYIAPSWEDGATKDDVMPSVDASWQNADADMQRAAFLAGWDAAIESAAMVIDGWHLGDRGSKAQYERLERIATAIRALGSPGNENEEE